MLSNDTFSNRIIAAVSAMAFSIVIFAAAITPANQGALLPVVMA